MMNVEILLVIQKMIVMIDSFEIITQNQPESSEKDWKILSTKSNT